MILNKMECSYNKNYAKIKEIDINCSKKGRESVAQQPLPLSN